MRLVDVADTSAAVAGVAGRTAKVQLLADCLRRAGPQEVAIAASYLSGALRQRRTGLGYAALRDLPAPAAQPTLELAAVDTAFEQLARLSGPGSTTARRERFHALMAQATASEQRFLAGLVAGELRQGALDGVLTEAVARAADVPPSDVRAAVTVAGALVPVAAAALTDRQAGLSRFALSVGSPLRPMLATPAPNVSAALGRLGRAAVEWKLDGIRVQVHRRGDEVFVFSRTLDDITAAVPELVEAVRALDTTSVVLDAETIAVDPDGRPLPFQRTAARVGSRLDVATARRQVPLSLFVFDCLHADGVDMVAEPARQRWSVLERLVPEALRIPRIVTDDPARAQEFFDAAIAAGHEGVIVKSLDAPYEAGRRGAAWLKAKPRHTLDLVVLAAEWGHGRRRGWLSNLHLGARDPDGRYGPPGGFVMLGKTFKGLTDAMLAWQTERFLELVTAREGHVVYVRPEQVVEVAFDGVQTSGRYPAGMALRFARVLRHRSDKFADEADSVDMVRTIFQQGHRRTVESG